MATVSGAGVGSDYPEPSGIGPIWRIETYAVPSSGDGTAQDDVIQVMDIPDDAVIIDGWLKSTDLDTNGTPTISLSVGDGGDADRFLSSNTLARAGGVARFDNSAGFGHEYTAADTIDVTVVAAAATKAAGTLTLAVCYVTSGV